MEMKEVSERINNEFGDYVFVPRLKGHGEVPSQIKDLSLDDWYEQVEEDFDLLKSGCENVNVVGSSFGGALTLRLAEQKDLKNVYLANAYLTTTNRWYYGFPVDFYLDYFSDYLIYTEKVEIGQINDPEGLKMHVAYRNFPIQPVKNSFGFLETTKNESWKVEEPVLILHSPNDVTADFDTMKKIFEDVSKDGEVYEDNEDHTVFIPRDKLEVFSLNKNTGKIEKKRKGTGVVLPGSKVDYVVKLWNQGPGSAEGQRWW